jgi:hypothetical protein
MSGPKIDVQLLRRFEKGLDPAFPEKSEIPARVLGYGEISTVLEIGAGSERKLAYKRLAMFNTEKEAKQYQALYTEYVQVLQDRIGLRVVPSNTVRLTDEDTGRVIVYIVQEKLSPETIGHKAIHHISSDDVSRLALAVLRETRKVFDFNREHRGELEIGFDGQISNWALGKLIPESSKLAQNIELVYFDTSSPLIRKNGEEQLDPELFLRSSPSFLVWIIRLLFLKDVMTRYYSFRRVAVDLIANFYKEQRPDLISVLVDLVNRFFAAEIRASDFKPITAKEAMTYYREDVCIWRIYLALRKIDRFLHRLLGRDYPYVLPGKTKR